MRSYLLVSGAIFFVIVVIHVLRVAGEGTRLAMEPGFVAASALAIGMCIWAFVLWRRKP